MIADLRADSSRWRQEQRMTGTRGSNSPVVMDIMSGITVPDICIEPYVGSSTYQAANSGRPLRRQGDSPSVEGPYGPPPSRDRMPAGRMPVSERIPVSDSMDIDPPSVPQSDRRYGGHSDRAGYQPDSRAYPSDSRAYPSDSRSGYQPEPASYGRPPVTSSYAQDSRYAHAPNYSGGPPSNDGAPPGYVRQGNYYVPVSSAYETGAPAMPPSRSEPPQYAAGPYGQPPSSGRADPRDPRYGGQSEYSDPRDPRYAYPSPAATVSSVSARDREPVASPPAPRFASYRGSTRLRTHQLTF